MLTFITPQDLVTLIMAKGGSIDMDTATQFLRAKQTLTITAEDLIDESPEIEKQPYVVQLFNSEDNRVLTVHLVNARDSGETGGVEISVRAGAPDFVITDVPTAAGTRASESAYRLNVATTTDGALVSAEEPFNEGGLLGQLPFDEDLSSELALHVLSRRFKYKNGHFLASTRLN